MNNYKNKVIIYSPVIGEVIENKSIPDQTFSENMMGPTIGIKPNSSFFCSPCDGELVIIANNGHAYAIKTDDGIKIMVHIGIDTNSINAKVKNKKEWKVFKPLVNVGEHLRAHQPVMEVNLNEIIKRELSIISPTMILSQSIGSKKVNVFNSKRKVTLNSKLFEVSF